VYWKTIFKVLIYAPIAITTISFQPEGWELILEEFIPAFS
jgi:hypothetical protein